jgi:hypothetical protein
MTKVEDLKRVIVAIVADANFDEEMDAHRTHITLEQCKIDAEADIDLLITAAKEEERERIRNALDVTFIGGAAMTWHFDSRKRYIVPYSVLAPKESEK